jgi:hypothetical protein
MVRKIAFLVSSSVLCAGAAVPAIAQDYTPFEQCLIDYCFGHYQGDPAGYQRCREWCFRQFGPPQAAPTPDDGKLD